MARSLLGILGCLCAVSCAGEDRATLLAEGPPGIRLKGIRLLEERDGRLALDLRARSAEIQPSGKEGLFRDLDVRFDLADPDSPGNVKLRGVHLTAAWGRMREGGDRLEVGGQVRVRDEGGRTLTSELATYDHRTRSLTFPGPAVATSARGRARGKKALVELGPERLSLEGSVEVEVLP